MTQHFSSDVDAAVNADIVAMSEPFDVPSGAEVHISRNGRLPTPEPIDGMVAAVTPAGLVPLMELEKVGKLRLSGKLINGRPIVIAVPAAALEFLNFEILDYFKVQIGWVTPNDASKEFKPLRRQSTLSEQDALVRPGHARISVSFSRLAQSNENVTIVAIIAFDAQGRELELPEVPYSDTFEQHYFYLSKRKDTPASETFVRSFELPEDAVRIEAEIKNFSGPPSALLIEQFDLMTIDKGILSILVDPRDVVEDDVVIGIMNDGKKNVRVEVEYSQIDAMGRKPTNVTGFEKGKRAINFVPGQGEIRVPLVVGKATQMIELKIDLPDEVFATSAKAEFVDNHLEPLKAFIKRLNDPDLQQRHRGIVILYSTAGAFQTGALPLRSHYLARELAKRGYLILFLPMASDFVFSEVEPNLYQIPTKYFDILRAELKNLDGFKRKIFLCSTRCDASAVLTLDTFKHLGWTVVYEVRDDMEGMQLAGFGKWYNPVFEDRFYRSSDCVICVSETLRDRSILKGSPTTTTFVLKNGIDDQTLHQARLLRNATHDLRQKHAHIGYFGHMFGGRFDRKMVEAHVEGSPHYFHFIGPGLAEDNNLTRFENVRVDPRMTIDQFMIASSKWKVGLLPFFDNRLTLALDPIKQYLYLALGMRIVSADVVEMRSCPLTWIYHDEHSYHRAVHSALNAEITDSQIEEVDDFLKSATWQKRTEAQIEVIEGVMSVA